MEEALRVGPELRDWAIHNLDRGIPPGPLVRAMREQGIDGTLADALVHSFWAARAEGRPLPEHVLTRADIERARYRPDASRLSYANVVDGGDRQVRLALRLAQPAVAVFDQVMSAEECDQLVAMATPRLRPSTVVDPASGRDAVSAGRTSEGMFFHLQENALVARIDQRLSRLMGLPLENGEGLQVLRYPDGAQSRPHYDFLMPLNEANKASLTRSGQRVGTMIVYLNHVARGGETVFPETGLTVAPRKGSALRFEYCNVQGQLDPLSLHAGAPVLAGEKWIVTKWMRQRRFISA